MHFIHKITKFQIQLELKQMKLVLKHCFRKDNSKINSNCFLTNLYPGGWSLKGEMWKFCQ